MPAAVAQPPSAHKLKKERVAVKPSATVSDPAKPSTSGGPANAPVSGRRAPNAAPAPKSTGSAPASARGSATPAPKGSKAADGSSKSTTLSTAQPLTSARGKPPGKDGASKKIVGFEPDPLSLDETNSTLKTTQGGASLNETQSNLAQTNQSVFEGEFVKSGDGVERAGTPDFLKTGATSGKPGKPSGPTVDTKLRQAMDKVSQHWQLVRRQSAIGSPSDAELKKLDEETKKMEKAKLAVARDVASWGQKLSFVQPDEILEDFADFLDRLILETDAKPGNLDLVRVLMTNFSPAVEYAKMVSERQWMTNSAVDGSLGFMRIFFALPGIADAMTNDIEELVCSCCYNLPCRIPLFRLLLEFDSVMRWEQHQEELHRTVNEFFTDVASKKKAVPREDRNGRMDLLAKMLVHPHLGIDCENELGEDGLSVFLRAAAEGDDDVLQLLLSKKKIKDINRSIDGNNTALILATFGNHVFCVRLLLAQPGIKRDHVSSEGTAVEIAKKLKRHPEIIAALEK
jgi:hypothetical protein